MALRKIERALISVSDKTDLLPLAQTLHEHGTELISTGGTAKVLKEAGLPVVDIAEYTQFPEMMGGRLKTLHPLIFGGILMRRGEDEELAKKHGIKPIDMVVVNLYPFRETVAKESVTEAEAIEQIDIGGPSLLRAAAKNMNYVTVLTAIRDYAMVIEELKEKNGVTGATRRKLAITAFDKTASYDQAIAEHLRYKGESVELLDLHYEKV
ncbi:MAG: bifunctional phosphoribosylaminoimidazolecarboxamide formyltransferase/IMP cyclohydrolase, partial [Patescibacteria group bacterium]